MAHGVARSGKVLAIGLGALLAPVLFSGAAGADPGHGTGSGIAEIPPVAPVQSVLLARGSAGEFRVTDAAAGVHLRTTGPTDLAMVQVTVQPHSSTGWHTHRGPSVAIVTSGAVRLIEPQHGRGCTEETLSAGTAFVHPSDVHDVANDGNDPAVVTLTYFLPPGASPALMPVDPPPGC